MGRDAEEPNSTVTENVAAEEQTAVVAGYTASNSSGSLNADVVLNQESTTFYWVFAVSGQKVTFTLNYTDTDGNNQSSTAQATFNVAGATGS